MASSISPAFRSASIAICFPGIASSVNLAATSLIRVAPLVITTNCTMIRMINSTTPTTTLPLVTTEAKVWITPPAAASAASGLAASAARISRVVAMFSTSRISVVPSKTDGNTLKSSGLCTKIVVSRINAASARFAASSTSIINAGSGTTITINSPTNANGTNNDR